MLVIQGLNVGMNSSDMLIVAEIQLNNTIMSESLDHWLIWMPFTASGLEKDCWVSRVGTRLIATTSSFTSTRRRTNSIFYRGA